MSHLGFLGILFNMDGAMIWKELLSGAGDSLLHQVSEAVAFDVQTLDRLRRDYPRETVRAAVALVTARRKATKLFRPEGLALDVEGVEQATPWIVAKHKACRFSDEPVVIDLCCGVGGDSMALANVTRVLAIDREPLRAWMTAHNAGWAAAAADVTHLRLSGQTFHLDPSRRAEGRRHWRYSDYQPGPAFIEQLLTHCPDGAIKLGPGVDLDVLPTGETELISLHGKLVQAVLWTGRLAGPSSVRATRLPDGVTLTGPRQELPLDLPRRFLLAVDPALERTGLVGTLCVQEDLAAIHPQLGLLTSDRPEACAIPWVKPFELLEKMPWRAKKVRRWLSERNAGLVEVKTRGGAIDPEKVRRELRGKGDQAFTVFVLRQERKLTAYVTRRLS